MTQFYTDNGPDYTCSLCGKNIIGEIGHECGEGEEDCCFNCVYCDKIDQDGYEGYCRKMGVYLKTINDRLCKKYLQDNRA